MLEQLLAEYAEAIVLQHDGLFTESASRFLQRALYLQPNNRHALWVAGLADFFRGDVATAIERWELAHAQAPAGSEEALMNARSRAEPVTVP
ncbi:MAG: hypothetical protein KKA36_03775 [Gammaproteobacteria bacterium]|nr:hypothetical protein [Gammaproteobacteria bacterium]MBU2478185.1 hypothetical protein [Gammaproteobacteria bacterium]